MRTLLLLITTLAAILMAAVVVWATRQQSITAIPAEVWSNPWFLTTVVDCYLGFCFVAAWAAVRENSWPGRLLWPFAILLLGNFATAAYLAWIIASAPADSTWKQWLTGDVR